MAGTCQAEAPGYIQGSLWTQGPNHLGCLSLTSSGLLEGSWIAKTRRIRSVRCQCLRQSFNPLCHTLDPTFSLITTFFPVGLLFLAHVLPWRMIWNKSKCLKGHGAFCKVSLPAFWQNFVQIDLELFNSFHHQSIRHYFGGWAFGKVVTSPLGAPTSRIGVSWFKSSSAPKSSFLLLCTLEDSRWWLTCLRTFQTSGRPELNPRILAFTWASLCYCRRWRNEPIYIVCLSPFQNKQTDKNFGF